MDFKSFEKQFVPFCKTPGESSGAPSSYSKAILYLAEYLGLSDINDDTVKEILAKEDEIKDKTSPFYKEFLSYLESKGRISYLRDGFVSAAFPSFHRFLLEIGAKSDKTLAEKVKTVKMCAFQQIFFGAPGTGKSFKVNTILGENRKRCFSKSDHPKSNGYTIDLCNVENVGFDVWSIDNIGFLEKKLVSFESDNNVTNPRHSALRAYIEFLKKYKDEHRENRTTFHPDYDYAQFVGAYKPNKGGDTITYSFVPQVFAKAYVTAWTKFYNAGKVSTDENQVYLIIEEINRGNCAQIFGDIFQLLDRDDGFSQYAIDADCDFAKFIEGELNSVGKWDDYKASVGEGKLMLPPNLNILATMNTSDQSLFPMDSAFKRRFDWEYVPISFDDKEAAKYQIDIDGSRYPWQKFVETVNDKILTITESEDKQLGEFFIKPDKKDENGECVLISCERFLGKVMFYLWNEVCKDEHNNESFFRVKNGNGEEYFTFQDLYKKEKSGYLKQFMDELLKKE